MANPPCICTELRLFPYETSGPSDIASHKTDKRKSPQSAPSGDKDRAHQGEGVATLVALPNGGREIQLSEFQITNGPDLEVSLSMHPEPASSLGMADNQRVALCLLEGTIGDQAFPIPADINISDFQSVVI